MRAPVVLETIWRALTASLLDLNFLYYSLGAISILGLSGGAALLVRGGRLEGSSFAARHVARVRGALPAVLVLCATTLAAGLQGNFEQRVHAWLGWDFTPLVFGLEGRAAERFQAALRAPWLDVLLVAVYTAGAFLLYLVPFFILVGMGRGRSAMRIAGAFAIVWAVGIVAYFFLPVNEVWMTASAPYHYTDVENVLFTHVPETRTSEAYLNAVNNNFPSLHVALSATVAFALWRARERWLAVPCTVVALGVWVATVYLGIHWFVDVAAGLLLAWGAVEALHRLVPLEAAEVRAWPWTGPLMARRDTTGSQAPRAPPP